MKKVLILMLWSFSMMAMEKTYGVPAGEFAEQLIEAAKFGDQSKVKILVNDYQVDINEVNSRGETAIMMAALWNYPDIVKFLLERSARYNQRSHDGFTAYMFAKYQENEEVVKELEKMPRLDKDFVPKNLDDYMERI